MVDFHVSVSIAIAIELALLTFHVSVSVFIFAMVRKRRHPFTSGFFALYLAQSVVDCVSYVVNSLFLRILQNKLISRSVIDVPYLPAVYIFASGYVNFYEYIGHATIAINRYTVFAFPESSRKVWSGRPLAAIIFLQFLLAFACAGVRLWNDTFVLEDDHGIAVKGRTLGILNANATIAISVSLSTCFLSCFLETRTLALYRRLSPLRKNALRNDYLLLLYAIFGLIAQVLMAAYYTVMYPVARVYPEIFIYGQFCMPYLTDLLALSGSICLFVTSSIVRKGYIDFYGLRGFSAMKKNLLSATIATR